MIWKYFKTIAFSLIITGSVANLVQATTTDEAEKTLTNSIKKASVIGQKTAQWQNDRTRMIEEIQELELQKAWTEFQLGQTNRWLNSEKNNTAILEENLANAAQTRANIDPFLEVIYAQLERHIETDKPFQREERERRLSFIRSTLDSPQSTMAEKVGKILSAIQVEMEYGYNVEVTKELIQDEGHDMEAVNLRIGRLSLLRLINGGEKLERYTDDKWLELSSESIPEIKKGMEIAQKKRVTTVISLPIGNAGGSK